MAQCLDYSLCRFDAHPTFLVFACPLPTYLTDERYFLRFPARYHVGWIDFTWSNGLRFMLGDEVVWNEKRGVCNLGQRSNFPKRYGNRDGDSWTL
jgi:hypothetical protein